MEVGWEAGEILEKVEETWVGEETWVEVEVLRIQVGVIEVMGGMGGVKVREGKEGVNLVMVVDPVPVSPWHWPQA